MTHRQVPTLAALRSLGAVPRLHPNGFIQLDLGPTTRLHVWPATILPMPHPMLPIHDHVYGFVSTIIKGRLTNRTIDLQEDSDGDYHLYGVFPWKTHGRTSKPTLIDERRYRVTETDAWTYADGETYRIAAGAFHESVVSGPVVTIIEIEPYDPSRIARVACPTHLQPDTHFRREVADQELLWSHIGAHCP